MAGADGTGVAGTGAARAGAAGTGAAGTGAAGTGGADVGLTAARRALRLDGAPGPLSDPVLVEIVPPSNIAVGTVPWGPSGWVAADRVYRVSTAPDAEMAAGAGQAASADRADRVTDRIRTAAAGHPLLIVVRDAHRYPAAQAVTRELLAARPDAVVIEMGLPVWRPPAQVYLATFGATRASSRAAAEILGLTSDLTQEVSAHGPDRP